MLVLFLQCLALGSDSTKFRVFNPPPPILHHRKIKVEMDITSHRLVKIINVSNDVRKINFQKIHTKNEISCQPCEF